jgi:hypothetical protein
MKKMRLLLLLTYALFAGISVNAQPWVQAGPDESNQPSFFVNSPTSLNTDNNGGQYYAYGQYTQIATNTYIYKASVRRWDGTHWQQVGEEAFSDGQVAYLQIAAAPDATPYVVYKDYSIAGKLTVKKFNGSSWVTVGAPVSAGGAANSYIAVDTAGTPYVAYSDSLFAKKITVKKWDGTAWQTVGTAGFGPQPMRDLKFRLGSDGLPYVLAQYNVNGNYVNELFHFTGTLWSSLGVAGQCQMSGDKTADLAIAAGDIPYVAFADGSNFSRVTVKKYTGGSWSLVGNTGVSPADAEEIEIRTDPLNGPYISCISSPYSNSNSYDYPVVRHFNGTSWQTVGPDTFVVKNLSRYASFFIDTAHAPHLICFDEIKYSKVLMRKFDGTNWTICGGAEGIANTPSIHIRTDASPDGKKAFISVSSLNSDHSYYPSRVCRYDDSVWTVIGESGPGNWAGFLRIMAVDPDGRPWIAVRDPATSAYQIWRFADTAWIDTNINLINYGAAADLCFDGAGNAYFASQQDTGGILVRKHTPSGGWTSLIGSPIDNNSSVSFIRIKTNNADTIHILYGIHGSGSQYAFGISKYTGIGWTSAINGTINSGSGVPSGSTPDFAFDSTDVLHLTYLNTSQLGILIRRYNAATGTFTNVTPPLPALMRGLQPGIKFAPDGSLYFYYSERTNTVRGSTTVMRQNGSTWSIIGTSAISKSNTYDPDLVFLNNRLLTTFTDGAAYAYKYDCVQPVTIITQPADTAVCTGANAAFATVANDATAYRWQMNTGSGWANVPSNVSFSGVAGSTLNVTNTTQLQSGTRFRCIYTNSCGTSMISETAVLSVEMPNLPAPTINITADHSNVCQGTTINFTATTTNPGVTHTYEWRINGTVVSGANGPTFSTALLNNGDVVSCEFNRQSACGNPAVIIISNLITVNIVPLNSPSISIAAVPGTSINQGQTVVFTAVFENGGLNPQILWLINNNPVTGANGITYTTNTLANGDQVTAKITRSDTCADVNNATSLPLAIEVATAIQNINAQYGIKIYPQPARDYILISGSGRMPAGRYKIALHTMTGQLLMSDILEVSGKSWTRQITIPANTPAGIYRLSIWDEKMNLGSMITIVR